MPVSVEQYQASRGQDSRTIAPQAVRLYNLRRVLDGDLPAAERAASLRLVDKLGGVDATLAGALAAVASDPKTPPEFRGVLEERLLQAGHNVGKALPVISTVPAGSPLRRAILERLIQSPDKSMFADVIKAWAVEPPGGADEQRYRQAVEKMSGVAWEAALLDGMNSDPFYARGSAMTVLAARMTASALASKASSITPRTEPMAALKAAVTQLGFVPKDGQELLALVSAHQLQPNSFPDVARLARQWKTDGAYEFSIRDFHLLSRLFADTLRKPSPLDMKRADIVSAVSASLSARQHVPRAGATDGGDSFSKQVSSLSMADLWNLHLLNQMLIKPRVLLGLRVMADRDRADTKTQWGGLVVYESGGAEARIYPPEKDAPPDDRKYVPSRQMITDGRDSMCRFVNHFEKADNAARAGPTAEELAAAREGNYYGLVLTTVADNEFCAHYYNPQGIVISLGRFAFKF
jgi:hypothetical protein